MGLAGEAVYVVHLVPGPDKADQMVNPGLQRLEPAMAHGLGVGGNQGLRPRQQRASGLGVEVASFVKELFQRPVLQLKVVVPKINSNIN